MNNAFRLPFVLLVLLLPLLGGLSSCSESKANSETDFWVRGNCNMCKKTIETALSDVAGVATATYDLESNTAHVSFDSAQTNQQTLQQAVANAGYATKTLQEDSAAYAELPKCCKKPEDM